MGAVSEYHTYVRLADLTQRVDFLDDKLAEGEARLRGVYRHLYHIDFIRLEEHKSHIKELEDIVDDHCKDLTRLTHNNDFLFQRLKLLLSFTRKIRKKTLRKFNNLDRTIKDITRKFGKLSLDHETPQTNSNLLRRCTI